MRGICVIWREPYHHVPYAVADILENIMSSTHKDLRKKVSIASDVDSEVREATYYLIPAEFARSYCIVCVVCSFVCERFDIYHTIASPAPEIDLAEQVPVDRQGLRS